MVNTNYDSFYSEFKDISPPSGFNINSIREQQAKLKLPFDSEQESPEFSIQDDKIQDSDIQPPVGLETEDHRFQNLLNDFTDLYMNQEQEQMTEEYTPSKHGSKFDNKNEFTHILNSEYRQQLSQRGLNPDFASILVAQDALESGYGAKVKGQYNYGNIASGDKGLGYYESSSGHKFTNYSSISDYVSAKLDLLSNSRYNFFASFNPNSDVAVSMQVLADRGYCPNSPSYGKKISQVHNNVLRELSQPFNQSRTNGDLIKIDIEDLLKSEGITEINGKKIKFGNRQKRADNASFGVKNSHHKEIDPHTGYANARDISIVNGTDADYAEFRKVLLNNARVRDWLSQKGWGIINEVSTAALKKTNGTGPHFHFGPDQWALRTWEAWLNNPDIDVTQIISKA